MQSMTHLCRWVCDIISAEIWTTHTGTQKRNSGLGGSPAQSPGVWLRLAGKRKGILDRSRGHAAWQAGRPRRPQSTSTRKTLICLCIIRWVNYVQPDHKYHRVPSAPSHCKRLTGNECFALWGDKSQPNAGERRGRDRDKLSALNVRLFQKGATQIHRT